MENTPIKDILTLKFVPCHRLESRSIKIFGKQIPVCARCGAILLGYLAIPFLFIGQIHIPIFIGVLLNLPMMIDGYTQKWKWRTSNNFLRVTTGLLSGFGMSALIVTSANLLTKILF